MANPVAETFREAAELNLSEPGRQHNIVHVEGDDKIVISGDIHGSRVNLNRIISYSKSLGKDTILVLQEIIHGPPDDRTGFDRSIELMNRVARMKINRPGKTFILMGNHDLAQFSGGEIAKEGRGACEEFINGVNHTFGDESPEVLEALDLFCNSMPLAIRFSNGIVASHTLPAPNSAKSTDIDILNRPSTDEDYCRGGSVYQWLWGRDQKPEQLECLAEKLDASLFVLGHRHIFEGLMTIPPCALAIDSSNPMGCIFEFRADETISIENADTYVRRISKLN